MYGQLQSFKFREGPKPASATSFSQYSRGKYSSGWEEEGENRVSWQGQPCCSQGLCWRGSMYLEHGSEKDPPVSVRSSLTGVFQEGLLTWLGQAHSTNLLLLQARTVVLQSPSSHHIPVLTPCLHTIPALLPRPLICLPCHAMCTQLWERPAHPALKLHSSVALAPSSPPILPCRAHPLKPQSSPAWDVWLQRINSASLKPSSSEIPTAMPELTCLLPWGRGLTKGPYWFWWPLQQQVSRTQTLRLQGGGQKNCLAPPPAALLLCNLQAPGPPLFQAYLPGCPLPAGGCSPHRPPAPSPAGGCAAFSG